MGEQLRRLDALGIAYDVTPGVPAFAAAAAALQTRIDPAGSRAIAGADPHLGPRLVHARARKTFRLRRHRRDAGDPSVDPRAGQGRRRAAALLWRRLPHRPGVPRLLAGRAHHPGDADDNRRPGGARPHGAHGADPGRPGAERQGFPRKRALRSRLSPPLSRRFYARRRRRFEAATNEGRVCERQNCPYPLAGSVSDESIHAAVRGKVVDYASTLRWQSTARYPPSSPIPRAKPRPRQQAAVAVEDHDLQLRFGAPRSALAAARQAACADAIAEIDAADRRDFESVLGGIGGADLPPPARPRQTRRRKSRDRPRRAGNGGREAPAPAWSSCAMPPAMVTRGTGCWRRYFEHAADEIAHVDQRHLGQAVAAP